MFNVLITGKLATIVAAAQDWTKAHQAVGKPKSGTNTGLESVADRASLSGVCDKTQRKAVTVGERRRSPCRPERYGIRHIDGVPGKAAARQGQRRTGNANRRAEPAKRGYAATCRQPGTGAA